MKLALAALVLLFAAGCAQRVSTCRLIHKPKAGCPGGWALQARVFTEKDGSKIDACLAPEDSGLNDCVDELRPHESYDFKVTVEHDTPIERNKI